MVVFSEINVFKETMVYSIYCCFFCFTYNIEKHILYYSGYKLGPKDLQSHTETFFF